MAEKKERIAIWDNYKCILILAVVMGHMYAGYDDLANVQRLIFLIYSFHMPAFVFVSGLFAQRTIREKRWDKVIGFLILFLLAKAARYIYPIIVKGKWNLPLLNMNDVTWYAFAIFIFCLITILIRRVSPWIVLPVSVALSLFAGFSDRIGTWLSLSRIFTYYPFFYLGYVLKAGDMERLVSKKAVKVCAVLFLAAAVLLLFLRTDVIYSWLPVLKGKTAYSKWKFTGLGAAPLFRLGWYLYASLFSLAVLALTPVRRSILTVIGSRTMTVYTWHYLLMFLFNSTLHGKELINRLIPLQQVLVVFAVSILITCIASFKPFCTVTERIVYPRWIHRLFQRKK